MRASQILQQHQHKLTHDKHLFHCKSIVGMLNYLEKSSRPDIAYTVQQCDCFSQDPKQSHTRAVIHIVKYLK